ncbi:hypothetical protein EJ07DRAFT_152372 [Lizonia empirigonia]|nr:hypothetical protein EJ07DRAFT_152372 [Lizonia empirigonia]
MNHVAARKALRRIALVLILVFQLSHFPLQVHHLWTPPRDAYPKLGTLAKLNECAFVTVCCYKISEKDVDVKLGRLLVRGWGIEALLWGVAVWSAALVGVDDWCGGIGLLSLSQLLAVDVLVWTEMLSSAVGLVERKGAGEGGVEKRGLELSEKEEV